MATCKIWFGNQYGLSAKKVNKKLAGSAFIANTHLVEQIIKAVVKQ